MYLLYASKEVLILRINFVIVIVRHLQLSKWLLCPVARSSYRLTKPACAFSSSLLFHSLTRTTFAYTLQTYHHQEHRFRSWPTQITSPSHLHTQARVQRRNTYNHTYIKFLPGQNKTITLNPDKQLHSVHSRPCRI